MKVELNKDSERDFEPVEISICLDTFAELRALRCMFGALPQDEVGKAVRTSYVPNRPGDETLAKEFAIQLHGVLDTAHTKRTS